MQASRGLTSDGVERVAAADEHEVLLAGLDHLGGAVEELGVEMVDDDLAAVDPAGGVAPLGERVGGVEELLLQAGGGGGTRVAEHAEADRLAGETTT